MVSPSVIFLAGRPPGKGGFRVSSFQYKISGPRGLILGAIALTTPSGGDTRNRRSPFLKSYSRSSGLRVPHAIRASLPDQTGVILVMAAECSLPR